MLKRMWWVVLVLLLTAWPAAAQEALSPLDWIPADFAGFIRLDMDDADATLTGLNLALRAASIIQPRRFSQGVEALSYESILPLALLFDVEDAAFVQDILPWLGGDVALAYRRFEAPLSADQRDILMILPTSDVFLAASRLNRIIEGQHLGERATYRGVTLYIGDKSTFAVTPDVVLVGATELVQAALDLHAGEGERMTAQPAFRAILTEVPDDALVFGYLSGAGAEGVLSVLLSGATVADPLLEAAGEALRHVRGQAVLETLLLTGSVDAAGFVLKPARLRPVMIEASVILHTEADTLPPDGAAETDTTLLDLIPRSAMIVHSGTDIRAAVYDVLVALPFSNFGGRMLGAFPIAETIGSRSGLIEDPSAAEVQAAVNNFLASLETVAGFDMEADLLNHLSGSYAVGLLPNPNRPVPVLNTPFDTIFVAKTVDGEAALAGALQLIETLLDVQDLPTETIGDYTFTSLRLSGSGDAVLRLGVVDDTLVVVTGDALEQALAARRGDNRLTGEARWQLFTQDEAPTPEWYVDINAFYNTFFPAAGAPTPGQGSFRGLVANTDYLGDGLFSLNLRVTLPG